MTSLNQVQLIGRVGRDPEVRHTEGGSTVANLSIATSERWSDKNTGEKKERTEWHKVTIWGKLTEIVEKYIQKGSQIYVCGQLQTRKWQDQSGNDRYSTEVVLQGFNGKMILLGSPGGNGNNSGGSGGGSYTDKRKQETQPSSGADIDDDIPF